MQRLLDTFHGSHLHEFSLELKNKLQMHSMLLSGQQNEKIYLFTLVKLYLYCAEVKVVLVVVYFDLLLLLSPMSYITPICN